MMKRLYITYCSGTKDDSLKGTMIRVSPHKLYTSPRIQNFVTYCQNSNLDWAIFSDKYSVLFPSDKIEWYEMPPDAVNENQFQWLLQKFLERTKDYDEIVFYYKPESFHKVYKRLIEEARAKGIKIITTDNLSNIS